MATIVLASASPNPPVSSATALGLAFSWPRPVLLVEADPTGGSGIFAGYFQGEVEPNAGSSTSRSRAKAPWPRPFPQVVRTSPPSTVSLLSRRPLHDGPQPGWGCGSPSTWVLHKHCTATAQVVIVDAGPPRPRGLARAAGDGRRPSRLLTRNTLPALAAARSWANSLRSS